ncbi:MAG: hypothetical protein [Wendovervirus sonii]|uniref:Gamma-glutamylcyclotransferase AIG2-like domain-containing protein n=1 Tax=phage Lak_Megaphage_Sonny TaxID=3109229 RepID=A0ABZ0Z3B2_9CAUD|nr:MAG: hypothetical protein [phage Lak_Megaphage_Sonny]
MNMKKLFFVYGSYLKCDDPCTFYKELCYICNDLTEAQYKGTQLLSFDEILGLKYVSYQIIEK